MLSGDLVDRFCKALYITRGDAGNGYSSVFGSVNRMLLIISEIRLRMPSN